MFHVQTVSGPIAPDALGHSQIHEHIFVHRTPMAEKTPPSGWTTRSRSLEELRAYRAAGEASGGRPAPQDGMLSAWQRCRGRNSVAVAASTGYHLLGFYPADCWVHSLDEEGLYDLYCGELLEGMLPWRPEPDRRPAADGLSGGPGKGRHSGRSAEGRYAVFAAGGRPGGGALRVPLMLHGGGGEYPARPGALLSGGPDAGTAHRLATWTGRPPTSGPHDAIAATGVYLDYDTIGRFKYHSDEEEGGAAASHV